MIVRNNFSGNLGAVYVGYCQDGNASGTLDLRGVTPGSSDTFQSRIGENVEGFLPLLLRGGQAPGAKLLKKGGIILGVSR